MISNIMPRELKTAALLFAVLICIGMACATIWYVTITATDVPLYDEWRNVPYAAKIAEGRWQISDLFRVDQGHLALMLHVGTLISTLLAGYDTRVSSAIGVAFLLIAALVVAYSLFNRKPSDAVSYSVAVVAITASIFTMQAWENLAMPWLIDPAASLLFMVTALTLIDRPRTSSFVVGYLFAALCWLSFTNGLVLFFAASVQLLLANQKTRALWAAVGGVIVTVASVWFWIDRNPEDRGPGDGAFSMYQAINRFLALLGTPFTFSHHVVSADGQISASDQLLATAIGATFIITLAAYLWYKRRQIVEARYAVALLIFGLGSCALIALGRSDLPPTQAMSSRYVPVAMISYSGAVALILLTASRLLDRVALIVVSTALVASFTFAAMSELAMAKYRREAVERWRNTILSYQTASNEQLANPHFDPSWVRAWSKQLDDNKLGPFRADRATSAKGPDQD
ncbi:MAG: hypothetical protein EOP06_04215 [Proteobacteria bacterium]|nr:MAG: hypothetical protein EOP06_04215 [Pseudomonadota bacterium]